MTTLEPTTTLAGGLVVQAIPAFEDNYIWLLREPGSTDAVAVDPGDADPLLEALHRTGSRLRSVLVTHHHQDHIGGLPDLLAALPELRILGPRDPRIRAVTDPLGEGDQVQPPGLRTRFQVLAVPGHTSTHLALVGAGALFCGDTLFAGGCGRVFDGTFEQLAASLRRLAALPGETLCYCAHEYTLANLGFAQWVEPDLPALAERLAQTRAARAAGQPTVPSRLDIERATNPFLRTREPAVIAAAEGFSGRRLAGETEVFTALRTWKDTRYDA